MVLLWTAKGYITMTDRQLLKKALEHSELFEGTDLNEQWLIRTFERSQQISEIQNGIECIGLILRGSAEVSPKNQSSVSVLICGNVFGICNIFVREQMPTSLRAKSKCMAAFLPKDRFAGLLSENSILMYRYVRLCNRKMLYLADKLRLMSITSMRDRLIFWLQRNQNNGIIKLGFSKDELARLLGMSRASLFRIISELEEDGILSCRSSTIAILKPDDHIFDDAGPK